MQKKFTTKSDIETIALGSKLGSLLCGGEFIALTGDLGSGKTQFTKGIAAGLGISETVVSPTFTIERIYKTNELELHHFDLYRIFNDAEIASEIVDLTEDDKNIIVIEWPENIDNIMPKANLLVESKYISENERELIFDAAGEDYDKLVSGL
jgi:tRNA threonylcarbamoyladenosine biosynthesis protein TsaE